jgi:hypothetical protein
MTPEISASSAAESQKARTTFKDRAGNWFQLQ